MDVLSRLPNTKSAVIIISGGLDSTVALRLCVEKYGAQNVFALSFDYGQKQLYELRCAAENARNLGVNHTILDFTFFGEINDGFSANVSNEIAVPDLEDVLGDPQPRTYLAFRNLNMLSAAAAYAEVNKCETIVCGLQVADLYGYWDTTQSFVDAFNAVIQQNRIIKIKVIAPFNDLSKADEIRILEQLDGNVNLLRNTLTCYNPSLGKVPCGKCASCRERIKAFKEVGIPDPALG